MSEEMNLEAGHLSMETVKTEAAFWDSKELVCR